MRFELTPNIQLYEKGHWGNYCKAAFQAVQDYINLKKNSHNMLKGVNILISGNIPSGAGLSSSSALIVCIANAINVLNELNIKKIGLADILAQGEKYVGTEGGGMDQAASLMGKENKVMKIDFNPLKVSYMQFPKDYCIIVCNSLENPEPQVVSPNS